MKALLATLFTSILLSIGVLVYKDKIKEFYESKVYYSMCDSPVYYAIGSIDPQFNITKSDFQNQINKAANVWNDELDKPLFEYNENADLKVSLVFDERQRLMTNIFETKANVESKRMQVEQEIFRLENKKGDLNNKITNLNNEIAEWNDKGGAPEDEYNRIINEQRQINQEVTTLNSEITQLNATQDSLINEINNLNTQITNFNLTLESKPEEGIYNPQKNIIEIYFYDTENRFVHTTMHEFGHALGLDHISVENAIMQPQTSETTELTLSDKQMLNTYCRRRSVFEDLIPVVRNIREKIEKD